MQNTYTETPHHTFSEMFHRLALPFILFAAVLTLLLVLSWLLLLPAFTTVNVAGSVKDVRGLRTYKSELTASIQSLESKRNDFLFPLDGTAYARLVEEKRIAPKFDFLLQQIQIAGRELVPGTPDAVLLQSFDYVTDAKRARVQGLIHNVGPQSMTVQAQYVEAIRVLPGVEVATSSRYVREENADGEFYSPFTIELTLQ